MAKQQSEETKEVQINKPASILQELTDLHEAISKRAYELFETHGGPWGNSVADWFRAERELIRRPAIELRQKDGQFELEVALPGVDPKTLDVQVTGDDVLIRGSEERRQESDKGTVHVSEFASGQLFRSVHLPEPIDPDSVKAEFKNGLLRLTAAVKKPAARKVDVHAA